MKNCISSLSTLSLILICVVFLNSCGTLMSLVFGNMKTDDEVAQEKLGEVLGAIEKQDKDSLKALFAKKTQNTGSNFDSQIEQLFEYYQGNFSTYSKITSPMVGRGHDYNDEYKYYEFSCDIETTTQTYRIAMKFYTEDTATPDNIGIISLYIINAKEENSECFDHFYWGDATFKEGIHLGVSSSWCQEHN